MDSKINDGGPVFARPYSEHINDDMRFIHESQTGLSIRDYFAAAALQGLLAANKNLPGMDRENVDQMMAEEAYRSADAMIAERAKQ